ncbi:hypothetical protein B0H63DRAFT_526423 [Podospora didyma]|uniref:Carbohydrate Esterase Family 4 n=1 Tax=Podospora didyma TaxID=330526 RepID=A0AAE0N9K8_9PEZI|nr:hypothetical protein B0H63DRAFT_526423 [Podospora didyma]
MKLLSALLAASLGLATAHGDHEGQHVPKFVGSRRFLADMQMRKGVAAHVPIAASRQAPSAKNSDQLGKRQDAVTVGADSKCGAGVGSCPADYCCSAEGWCGKTKEYCSAPDCQINYGPGCDGNKKPSGLDTSGVARPKAGAALYGGAGIYDCVQPGHIALTFDDGPYIYTNDLLNKLKSYGARATFFMTGNNLGKGMISDPASIYPAILKRMHAEGHQIASHTWSHQNASQLTNTQFTNQMVWNEIAINSVLGFFPTYMRPPYSICEKNCQNILSTLGYHAIYFDLDTAGYLNDDAKKIQTSKNIWDQAIDNSDAETDSFLQIEHDIHYQTVYNLTDYILTSLYDYGYQAVTVGECLGDPAANWYRAGPAGSVSSASGRASTSTTARSTSARSTTTTVRFTSSVRTTVRTTSISTSPTNTRTTIGASPTATGVTTNGACGNGLTCTGSRFGACCSAFGFCGTGDDYCLLDNGCQSNAGMCEGIFLTSPGLPATTTPRSTATPVSTIIPSVNGYCGPEVGQTCAGTAYGTCCGPNSQCSSNTISCLAILGCQQGYGKCL